MNGLNKELHEAWNKQKVLRKSLLKHAAESMSKQILEFITKQEQAQKTLAGKTPGMIGQRANMVFASNMIRAYDDSLNDIVFSLEVELLDELNLALDEQTNRNFSVHTDTEGDPSKLISKLQGISQAFSNWAQQLNVTAFQ